MYRRLFPYGLVFMGSIYSLTGCKDGGGGNSSPSPSVAPVNDTTSLTNYCATLTSAAQNAPKGSPVQYSGCYSLSIVDDYSKSTGNFSADAAAQVAVSEAGLIVDTVNFGTSGIQLCGGDYNDLAPGIGNTKDDMFSKVFSGTSSALINYFSAFLNTDGSIIIFPPKGGNMTFVRDTNSTVMHYLSNLQTLDPAVYNAFQTQTTKANSGNYYVPQCTFVTSTPTGGQVVTASNASSVTKSATVLPRPKLTAPQNSGVANTVKTFIFDFKQ